MARCVSCVLWWAWLPGSDRKDGSTCFEFDWLGSSRKDDRGKQLVIAMLDDTSDGTRDHVSSGRASRRAPSNKPSTDEGSNDASGSRMVITSTPPLMPRGVHHRLAITMWTRITIAAMDCGGLPAAHRRPFGSYVREVQEAIKAQDRRNRTRIARNLAHVLFKFLPGKFQRCLAHQT